MAPIHTTLKVGSDGKVIVPVGAADAGTDVDVIVKPTRDGTLINGLTKDEWLRIFEETAGSIDDETFARPAPRSQDEKVDFES